jgi:hypothetical protein
VHANIYKTMSTFFSLLPYPKMTMISQKEKMNDDPLECESWKTQKIPIVLQFAKTINFKKTKNSWKRTWQTTLKKTQEISNSKRR